MSAPEAGTLSGPASSYPTRRSLRLERAADAPAADAGPAAAAPAPVAAPGRGEPRPPTPPTRRSLRASHPATAHPAAAHPAAAQAKAQATAAPSGRPAPPAPPVAPVRPAPAALRVPAARVRGTGPVPVVRPDDEVFPAFAAGRSRAAGAALPAATASPAPGPEGAEALAAPQPRRARRAAVTAAAPTAGTSTPTPAATPTPTAPGGAAPVAAAGAVDTDGSGLEPVPAGARLDWLAPSAEGGPAEPPSRSGRASVADLVHGIRARVAGVDLRGPATRRVLPQVGVAAVMAAATAGNALAGQFQPAERPVSEGPVTVARQQTLILPGSDPVEPVTSDLDSGASLVAGDDGVLRVRGADDASRSSTRDALPGCDGVPPEVPTSNGDVPDQYLCEITGGQRLRADAAEAFTLLDEAFTAHFGEPICAGSGYRTYGEQAALRRQKPGLAAPAGSSNHGLGLAIDLCGGVQNAGEEYWWLRENAPQFGWDTPTWARKGGSKYEPWHWEYVAGQW